MKSTKLLIAFIGLLLTPHFSYSIDTNAVKYFPLRIGNYWVYSYLSYPYGGWYRFSKRVTDTLVTNGHKYFKVRTVYSNNYQPYDEFLRVDSTQGNIRLYVTSGSCPWLINEKSRDSLSARLRDSSMYECGSFYPFFRCVDDTSTTTRCGLTRRTKIFFWLSYFEAGAPKHSLRILASFSATTNM